MDCDHLTIGWMKSAVQWLVVKAGSHTRCGWWPSSLAADHCSVKKEISQLDGLRSPHNWMDKEHCSVVSCQSW